jgi:hypothetical protein
MKKVMKQSILYSAALLLLAGCTEDTLMEGGTGGRVPIGVSVVGSGDDTRAGTHIQKLQFDAGETFNVYFASGSDTENAQFTTVNSVGTTEVATGSSQPCFQESATQAVMHAYYPETVNNKTKSFTVQQDQTTTTGFKQSDLMYATATATKSGKIVTAPLLFEHKLAKIVAMVTAGDSVQKIYSVRIVGGFRTISIPDGTTCTLGKSYSDPNNTSDYITMFDKPEGSKEVVCAAMLPPQDINEDFLEIVTDNGSYLSALTKVLEGSHTYNLAVVVGATKKTGSDETTPDAEGMVYTSSIISIDPVTTTYTYKGEAIMPVPKVRKKSDGSELVEGGDYQLAYVNNVNAGTATVIAVGLGAYTGQAVSTTFTIKKAYATISYNIKELEKSVIDNPFTNPLTNEGDGDVGYSSSNTSVATVNRMGKVTIVGSGTTTITASVSDGRNYTYSKDDNPNTIQEIMAVKYTITVGEFTLDALKNWVNDNNTSSRYFGYYVDKYGNVHAKFINGDIGRIGYYATTDVDENISGSRILVLALYDVGKFIWGSKGSMRNVTSGSGYLNTKRLQSYGSSLHPAAYAAWHYWGDQPDDASNWFLPSIQQWDNMMVTAQMSGTGTIAYGDNFWSSEESTADRAWSVTAAGSSNASVKTDVYAVRPCFAY